MKTRVHVVNEGWADVYRLYVIQEADGKLYALTAKGDGIERHEIKDGEGDAPHLIRLSGYLAKELFPAIVAGLSEKGFERPSESTLRGKCEAMERHLEDLRVLLKLGRAEGRR